MIKRKEISITLFVKASFVLKVLSTWLMQASLNKKKA